MYGNLFYLWRILKQFLDEYDSDMNNGNNSER